MGDSENTCFVTAYRKHRTRSLSLRGHFRREHALRIRGDDVGALPSDRSVAIRPVC